MYVLVLSAGNSYNEVGGVVVPFILVDVVHDLIVRERSPDDSFGDASVLVSSSRPAVASLRFTPSNRCSCRSLLVLGILVEFP